MQSIDEPGKSEKTLITGKVTDNCSSALASRFALDSDSCFVLPQAPAFVPPPSMESCIVCIHTFHGDYHAFF
ncbi:MAG: hypothetical protein ACWA5K_01385 [bacterium]